jgi:hypothetical protein
MPNSVVKSFAKRSGKSESEVEKLWKETEEEVKDKFKYKTSAFWAYLNKTVQHKLGLVKEALSFKQFYLLEKEEKVSFEIGQVVRLVKPLKDISATIGEVFTIVDVDEKSGDIRIANAFGPEYQDTYFKKQNFACITTETEK